MIRAMVIAALVALNAPAAAAQTPEKVRTLFRVFDGTEEVSAETRIRVRASGDTSDEDGIVLNGPMLVTELTPGIYDAQAIQHRKGRVLNVRWAERLVIVRYPDEGAEHLEVINFVPGIGALQLRMPPTTRIDPSLAQVRGGEGSDPGRARVHPGSDYFLIVAPAGTYTVTLTLPTGPVTLPTVEIPGDRTRMRVVGTGPDAR